MSQAFIIILTALGGIATGAFGDLVRRRLDKADRARKLIAQYRDPLLQAAFELQSRLYNITRGGFLAYARPAEGPMAENNRLYAVESTLWQFAHYLGWVEILRREVQFLDLGRVSRNKELQLRLAAVAGTLASDRPELRTSAATPRDRQPRKESSRAEPRFVIYRADQRAIGEEMLVERTLPDGTKRTDCLGYGDFVARRRERLAEERNEPFDHWCTRFENDVTELATGAWISAHPRLVETQRRLVDLIDLLDPDQERFPDRNLRGKLPAIVTADESPRRLAGFVLEEPPWPRAEKWADRYELGTFESDSSRTYRAGRAPWFDASLEIVITDTARGARHWINIDGRAVLPTWVGFVRRIWRRGRQTAPSGNEAGSLRLDGNGLLFWSSRRRARNAANDLLSEFDRPAVVADSIPRVHWLALAVIMAVAASVLIGWPGILRERDDMGSAQPKVVERPNGAVAHAPASRVSLR